MRHITSITILTACASFARAQAIDPANNFAWGENIGFLNFTGAGPDRVFANDDYLEGYIWAENIGWINLGSGAGPYPNTTGLDFGVNRDPMTGHLSGYAWSKNAGWVNFAGGSLASPANPARIESNRFHGYAWGENIGWINLDDDTVYVALENCPADLNGDGQLDFFDVSAFLSAFGMMDPIADFSQDGNFDFFDVSAFLQLFGQGCP